MIPNPTNFPNSIDSDNNLFLVHDFLRVRLLEDYTPGDTSIFIEGDEDLIARFPPTGIITLTEQCSDIDKRAISLYYGSRTSNSFDKLELLPEFNDYFKPKKITNVTMNVLDKHHNHLKDALISIQTFLGVADKKDLVPFGETITGRLNFIKDLVYQPRAWFNIKNRVGLAPLSVEFIEDSVRKGDKQSKYFWYYRKHNPEEEQNENWTEIYPTQNENEKNKYSYTFAEGGVFDVKMKLDNGYGIDEVIFEKIINVKITAPSKAIINITPKQSQKFTEGLPIGGPYTTFPKIRSTTNTFIDLEVKNGENPNNIGYSYAGELLDENKDPIDPIKEYSWKLGDELIHTNSNFTKASYSIGGYYDINLRIDTEFGSYRITRYEKSIDIIENQNLWLFNLTNNNNNGSGILETWEFGLTSEVFKKLGNQTISFDRDNSFLNEYQNNQVYNASTEALAKKEFFKNVAFAQQGTLSSGDRGNSLLFWASGGYSLPDQEIKIKKYNAFDDTYASLSPISRPWNWVSLISQETAYFLFGEPTEFRVPNSNFSNTKRTDYNLNSNSSSSVNLQINNFENGAEELLSHPSYFDQNGDATNGYFAVYRSTWKDSTGYILRNSSVNEFFRISDFYKTNGNLSTPFNSISRLPDMVGLAKTEGELVTLSNGVFFFNNSGEISAWNDVSLVWETGRAGSSSLSFRSLQDSNQSGFDNKSNSLLATSDNDKIAYLSFDYSRNTFIKFNSIDLTFSSAGTGRLSGTGKQLKLGIY